MLFPVLRAAERFALTLPIVAAGFLVSEVHAQSQAKDEAMLIDVRECVQLGSELARYACYEAEVRKRWPELSEGGREALGTAPGAEGQARSSRLEMQPRGEGVSVPDREGINSEVSEQDISSTIAALEEMLPGRYLITLENGQVWRQMNAERRMRLQNGQEVRLYPNAWGKSWRMSIPALRGYIQVERVQ